MKPLEPIPVVKTPKPTADVVLKNLGVKEVSDLQFYTILAYVISGMDIKTACEKEGVNFISFKAYEKSSPQTLQMVRYVKRVRSEYIAEIEVKLVFDTLKTIEKESDVVKKTNLITKLNKSLDRIFQRDNFEGDIKTKLLEKTQAIRQKERVEKTDDANKPLEIRLDVSAGKDFKMDETRVDSEFADKKDQYVTIGE